MKFSGVSIFSMVFAVLFGLPTDVRSAQTEQTEPLPCTSEQIKAAQKQRGRSQQSVLCADIELVEVKGRYTGLEVPEVAGRVYLDREYIERAPKGSGDINELIGRLAGVQLSDDAFSAAATGEIRAKELSISGGQAWQTGFFLDGINFNNRLDPGNYRDGNSVNDVFGGPQAFTVNSRIVDAILVYDSNIPAEYGAFSGGVVDVKTRSPADFSRSSIGLEYRQTKDSWGSYHLIEQNRDRMADLTEHIPNYDILDIGMYGVWKINAQHALLLNASYTESTIDVLSLGNYVATYRENTNLLLKYTATEIGIDRLDWSVTYAPYENQNILRHVLGSRQITEQGGLSSRLAVQHRFEPVTWDSKLAWTYSENSREAAAHFKPWLLAKGRDWGNADPANDIGDGGTSYLKSAEGNYGNLDKTQSNLNWFNKFSWQPIQWAGLLHEFSGGIELEQETMQRQRLQDHYYYNGARQYSSSSTPLNCNGFYEDCLELSLVKPLAQLAVELGGTIDFSNPAHLAVYENNILTTAQYFTLRQVYTAEHIDIRVRKASLFFNDYLQLGDVELNLGLRYSTDDFFNNHDLAPRLSGGYQLFGRQEQLLTFGLSRYYDANLLTYRLKELETPYYLQFRPIRQGVLQNWLRSSADSDYRFRYQNVATPYHDEFALGYKFATDDFGTFAIKGIKRWKRAQLASVGNPIQDSDGYYYRLQGNSGSGNYERLSLSWQYQFRQHSMWANFSYQQNYSSAQSYDEDIDSTPIDELVAYYDAGSIRVISLSELNRLDTNFSRPFKADIGLNSDWLGWFDTSLAISYVSAYDTAVLSTAGYLYGLNPERCPECEITSIVLPRYNKVQKQTRVLVDLGLRFTVVQSDYGTLRVTADIRNVFNSRTYLVDKGDNGVERGRQIWLGVKYDY